ncbi:DUF2164 domain-containing protein [Bacillus salacetis]|uniref:DUF2164 domain-containing protein n=1 Tax=Bacillus salacetis TaxID=2315464 RepID=A0A3A1R065_9BACI|nr:DUF2164 domain-containing protein [Bacillus salacetis]RIW35083.1 DUF2164 domain-containing protein [Bacillus salacetis]
MLVIKMSKEEKEEIIGRIQTFHYEQHGEEIGNIGAENLFEFFMKELGPYFYNKGIMDSKEVLMDKMLQVEDDLYALKRPVE